jgi:5-hydroxyisourate hydrolase-like protein (transthyretin family)
VLTVKKINYPEVEKEITITAGETIEVKFKLPKVEYFSGKVVDDKGKPVLNASVRIDSMSGAEKRLYRSAGCNRDGTFKVPGVRPGLMKVSAYATGYASYRKDNVEVAGVKDFVIVMFRCGSITGKIKAPGKITEYWIHVYTSTEPDPDDPFRLRKTSRRFTSRDGDFLIDKLPGGAYRLVVLCKGYPRAVYPDSVKVKNQECTSGIEVSIPGFGAELEITVIDEESGTPVKDATLHMTWEHKLSPHRQEGLGDLTSDHRTKSRADGKLRARNLPAGTYKFSVKYKGRYIANNEEINLTEGDKLSLQVSKK